MIPKLNSAHGSETRNIINKAIEVLNRLGIDVQTLVAEGQLTEEQYARLITIINDLPTNDQLRGILSHIASGSPKGVYNSLSDLVSDHPNGAEGIYVVESDGNWYFWDGENWSSGGVYQASQASDFNAVNLVDNGDFSRGMLGGWLSTYSNTVVDDTALNTADGSASFGQLTQNIKGLTVGDKYYFKADIKPLNETVYVGLHVNYAEKSSSVVYDAVVNQTSYVSDIFELTQSNVAFSVRHNYESASLAEGKKIEIDHVLVINLTKTFGAGYEPSKSEMDNLMNHFPYRWFDGSSQVANSVSVYQKIKDMHKPLNPILDIPRTGLMVKGDGGDYHARELLGTANQIEIENADGVNNHPRIRIPNNPTLMRPEVINTTYGDNIAPEISEWTGIGDTEFNDGTWTVQPKGQLKTTIPVEADAEYEVEIKWTDTNNYGVLDIPRLVVKFGDTTLPGQFVGYSDAGYKFILKAKDTGNTELTLGDGVEDWYAVITDVIIRKVISKATPSGKLGIGAFEVLTVGDNIAIGGGLKKRTSGGYNTSYGYDALRDTTVGTYNTAIGARALQQNTTGYHNIGIGFQAMQEMKSGYYNTGVGYSVMRHITTGNWNVAMGNEAMRNISSGIRNTSIGSRSLNDLTTGSFNSALGREAGMYPNEKSYTTKTGDHNVFLGYRTGQSHNEKTDESTAVGSYATARTRGVALGRKALAGGRGSVAIGTDSDGVGSEAYTENEFVLGTENHHVKVPGKLNIRQYTPGSTSDAVGVVGDVTTDDDYVYVKTNGGWKRSSLETF